MKYLQCHLRHDNTHTVAWIPSWVASAGNEIQLVDSDSPKIFWRIESVGDKELDEREVRQNERNFKKFQGSISGGGIDQ